VTISLRRPSREQIERHHLAAVEATPNYPAVGRFHDLHRSYEFDAGPDRLPIARSVLADWSMHRGAGVCTHGPGPSPGSTVTLWTRVFGVWLLFGCRVTDRVDTPDECGFTYATLPGHPEQGEETFLVSSLADGRLRLRITATSRPAIPATRLAGPIGRILQRRAADRYAAALRTAVADDRADV
jgi:uncharacterized protein (UPF0548 family)